MKRLVKEAARAVRENIALSVGMLDIDRFKRVNDTSGHAAGDVILRTVVERAQSVLRPYDVLGRFDRVQDFASLNVVAAEGAR